MPYKIPKQKPGFVGDWVLEESRFVDRTSAYLSAKTSKAKSMIDNYRHSDRNENGKKFTGNDHDRRQRFRSEIKRLVKQMKEKSITLK